MTPEIAAAIEKHAKSKGLPPAALKAVAWVESAGTFFWQVDGKNLPPIRPEVHKFYQFLEGIPRDRAVRAGLAHPNMGGVPIPNTWAGRYDFFRRMYAIDPEAAIKATSWGIGQVMGFNWQLLGFRSAQELMERAYEGLDGQLDLMTRYIIKAKLEFALAVQDWATFARGYNGTAYKKNAYDKKLAEAYKRFAANPHDGHIRLVQAKLKALGLYEGEVDGWRGPLTRSAVCKFQAAAGLIVDGDVSTLTVEAIDKYMDAAQSKKSRNAVPTIGAVVAAAAPIGQSLTSAIVEGDLLDVLARAQGIAGAVSSLLSTIGIGTAVSAVVVAAVTGFVLYRLIRRIGDDDKLADLTQPKGGA